MKTIHKDFVNKYPKYVPLEVEDCFLGYKEKDGIEYKRIVVRIPGMSSIVSSSRVPYLASAFDYNEKVGEILVPVNYVNEPSKSNKNYSLYVVIFIIISVITAFVWLF